MHKLDEALELLREKLNAGLLGGGRRGEPLVVLTNPAEGGAGAGEVGEGRLVLTLAAVRTSTRNGRPPLRDPGQSGEGAGPAAGVIEVDVLLTANFPGQYKRGLGVFANALAWLHENPVLAEGSGSDTISLTFVDLGFEEAAHVIGLAGVRGMPFALCRLRGIAVGG